MQEYLILKLQGTMQSWGGHTYEDYRPSHIFPTRSAVTGLIGACLGIDRNDIENRQNLDKSYKLTVRFDQKSLNGKKILMKKVIDFHTVLDARKADGATRKDAITSHREYLCDAEFTLALEFYPSSQFSLVQVEEALQRPIYTPVLGRRSCPLQRPLLEATVESTDVVSALSKIAPSSGTLYSEDKIEGSVEMRIRDVPMATPVRQFSKRSIYILGDENVL